MSLKRVISVGFLTGSPDIPFSRHSSRSSLADADIVLFETPRMSAYAAPALHNDRKMLGIKSSAEMAQDFSHWKEQLRYAIDAGKNVIVFMQGSEPVYDISRRLTSGLHALPVDLGNITYAHGEVMKTTPAASCLGTYWEEFCDCSEYSAYLDALRGSPLLLTKTGRHCVGLLISGKEGKGSIVVIPPLSNHAPEKYFSKRDRTTYARTLEGPRLPAEKGGQFWQRFLKCVVDMDRLLRASGSQTPPPEWVNADRFKTRVETSLLQQISTLEKQIEQATQNHATLMAKLVPESSLRPLLYEGGTALEAAILEALRLLGFSAEQVREGESEFDAVFTSAEGRFIGEAEGKENSAVNIDKFRQLVTNIEEDFRRGDGLTARARGVLFGNAFRLQPLESRGDFFTQKCMSSAEHYKTALVRTPDLFVAAKYLRDNEDASFAEKCRKAILSAEGAVVVFPNPPEQNVKRRKPRG